MEDLARLYYLNDIDTDEEVSEEEDGSNVKASRKRSPNLMLDAVIPLGDKVQLFNGKNPVIDKETGKAIEATYEGNNIVSYCGTAKKYSKMANDLLNKHENYNSPVSGALYWKYKDKFLKEYKKKES